MTVLLHDLVAGTVVLTGVFVFVVCVTLCKWYERYDYSELPDNAGDRHC